MRAKEGEIEIDFNRALTIEKLDCPGSTLPEGMKLVDFVIEESGRRILLELKDPSCNPKKDSEDARRQLDQNRENFIRGLSGLDYISKELVPKARDTYTFLHLMEKDNKPFIFVFLIGVGKTKCIDPALLVGVRDNLKKKIKQETIIPWKRKHISECLVLTEDNWHTAFPDYKINRIN